MSGIGAIFSESRPLDQAAVTLTKMMDLIAHRGDPSLRVEMHGGSSFAIAAHRLPIYEADHTPQPATDEDHDIHAVLDGGIYNRVEIIGMLVEAGHVFTTGSDAEIVLRSYIQFGNDFAKLIDGTFSFIIVDNRNSIFLLGRDHVGGKPLYYVQHDGFLYAASEMKSLRSVGGEVLPVDPGTVFNGSLSLRYVTYDKSTPLQSPGLEAAKKMVHTLLDNAVQKRLPTDTPVCVMFSGGVDSAIVLHLAMKHHPNVTAISFGLPGSSDIAIAQRYCAENKIRHVIYTFTEDDLIAGIDDAVYYGEFFEKIDAIDSVIAHFGYYVANKLGFRFSICGEGSDEIFAGYDLFKDHPSPHELSLYRLNNLHRTDLQRVDRASMRYGVSVAVPFMDSALVKYVMSLDFSYKLSKGTEKFILREAFRNVLPSYIIGRPKMRMPDGSGVKNTLIDHIKALPAHCPDELTRQLGLIGISDLPSVYFARKYLSYNYPFPVRRFKEVGMDYSESGYFEFIS